MFQLLGCCLMVFCGENHMVRESCFWQKKFRTSSGDTLVLNSVCVTTVGATPGGTPIIWKVGHVANHYFSLVCRNLLQFFALLAQLPYCLFPLRFFCFFDRRFSRSGFRRFSGVRQRKIPRFHGSKIRPSKIFSAFGCFWIFWPQIFMFQLLGCCLMVFCGENHMVRESCFWQKKFRTSSGDTLVLNSVCVTTVGATPGGTPIIWKVGHVANHYFSLVCRNLLQFFALLAQLPYCLFPLRFFCFFDRRFSRSGFRRFSGVRQRKIPRFHGSKIRPSKILSESIEIWHAGRLWCQASFSWTHSFNLEPFLFYWRLRSANLAIFGSVCENRP